MVITNSQLTSEELEQQNRAETQQQQVNTTPVQTQQQQTSALQPQQMPSLQAPTIQGGYLLAAPPRGFDTTAEDLMESWRRFKTEYEIYGTISELSQKPEPYQRAVLLMCLGENARAWMETVQIEYQGATANKIMEDVEGKCTATVTQTLRDFKFFSRELDQKKGEGFDSFYERIRSRSRMCKFGEITDRLVRSRLIIGIREKNLQKVLLAKDLTLTDVVARCRSHELGEQNATEISRSQVTKEISVCAR